MLHTIEIGTPAAVVFSQYQNVSSWPLWDDECQAVDLPDGLRVGSKGWLKPKKGPKAKIVVSAYSENKLFVVESKLPLCVMSFGHQLDAVGEKTVAMHWVRFDGPLSFLFRWLIGKQINATLPGTLRGLKAISESAETG
jgi:hypothetical protein